jgi:hypothetical protein
LSIERADVPRKRPAAPVLTNERIRANYKAVNKAGRVLSGALALAALVLFAAPRSASPDPQTLAQDPPPREVQKPSYDYMSGFLSRSTHPLGLKDDPATRRMLGQGPVAWAIRSGSRHVLD